MKTLITFIAVFLFSGCAVTPSPELVTLADDCYDRVSLAEIAKAQRAVPILTDSKDILLSQAISGLTSKSNPYKSCGSELAAQMNHDANLKREAWRFGTVGVGAYAGVAIVRENRKQTVGIVKAIDTGNSTSNYNLKLEGDGSKEVNMAIDGSNVAGNDVNTGTNLTDSQQLNGDKSQFIQPSCNSGEGGDCSGQPSSFSDDDDVNNSLL